MLIFPIVWSEEHMVIGVAVECYGKVDVKRSLQRLERTQASMGTQKFINSNKEESLR